MRVFGTGSGGAFSRRDVLKTPPAIGAGLAGGMVMAAAGPVVAETAAAPVWAPDPVPAQGTVKEGLAELPGTKLWYLDTGGDGPVVILMHSGLQGAPGFAYQLPVFAKAGYRAIAYSRRGYNKSDQGDKDNPGIGSEDLNNLLAYLKLDKVHVLAAAHGGYFALDFALVHPEKVRSLVILSSLMGLSEKDYDAANERIRPKFFESLPPDFQEVGPSYRAGNPEGLALWLELQKAAIPGVRITPKRVHAPLTWAKLESIKHPTLLMTGDGDLYLPPSLLRMQAAHMPQAEVVIIPEAGHNGNWEQPELFNKTVLAFLAKH
jgi:pimeloyl-ACP methyl ester carboxylesterase